MSRNQFNKNVYANDLSCQWPYSLNIVEIIPYSIYLNHFVVVCAFTSIKCSQSNIAVLYKMWFHYHLISRNSKFSETSDLSYTLPDHRATPYLAGVVLGYLIRRGYNRLNITKVNNMIWSDIYAKKFACLSCTSMLISYEYLKHIRIYHNQS